MKKTVEGYVNTEIWETDEADDLVTRHYQCYVLEGGKLPAGWRGGHVRGEERI